MEKFLIGYKQGNGEYVYVNNINEMAIGITIYNNNALEFYNESIAKNICEYLNLRDTTKNYIPLIVNINIKEVTE